ncbi:MAG: hypothetical protein ABJH72_24375 [Reichenbachiella sp.]|uniref:hypothetical protein n=1 Tax=Reichenbachiella sp. TaxID=2184521 RepID=UPI0032995C28
MRKTTIKLCIGALAWVISNSAEAQDQMQPVELVLNNSDTLKGYIDYEAWELDSKVVWFSETNEKKNVTAYEPNVVKAMFLGEKQYKGAGVDVEVSSRSSISLSKSKELNIERRVVFLQVLVDGDKQLLYYKDRLGKDHFYFFVDNEIKLLIYRQYLKLMTNTSSSAERFTKAENNKFRGQLAYYFNDCSQALGIESAQYNVSSMTNLYRQYYRCRKSKLGSSKVDNNSKEPTFYSSTDEKAGKFGIVAGLTFPKEATGTGFTLGFTHSILIPTEAANLTFHNELLHYSYSTEQENRSVSGYQRVITKVNQKESGLRFGTNMRIALSKGGGSQPFLGVGAAIGDGFRANVSGGLQGKKLFAEMKLDLGQGQLFTLIGFRF